MRKWWMIGFGMILASVSLAGAAIWYIRETKPEETAATQPTSDARTPLPLGAADPSTSIGGNNTIPVVNDDASGQVGGAKKTPNAGNSGSGSGAGAAKADDFAQYEKYKDEKGALFGDIRVGEGVEAHSGSAVKVNYRGWLTTGQLFDDTYQRGKSFEFQLGTGRVIAGWEQGLVGMKVGGKRRLIVPPVAGYGAEVHDPIPANSVLVFDIELLEVK